MTTVVRTSVNPCIMVLEDIVQKLAKFDIRDLVEFLAQQK